MLSQSGVILSCFRIHVEKRIRLSAKNVSLCFYRGRCVLFDRWRCKRIELVSVHLERKHSINNGRGGCSHSYLCFYCFHVLLCHCVCLLCLRAESLFIMVICGYLTFFVLSIKAYLDLLIPARSNSSPIAIGVLIEPRSVWAQAVYMDLYSNWANSLICFAVG